MEDVKSVVRFPDPRRAVRDRRWRPGSRERGVRLERPCWVLRPSYL